MISGNSLYELSRNDIGIQLEKLINKGETNKEMLQELKYKMYDWETKLEELVEEMSCKGLSKGIYTRVSWEHSEIPH